MVNTPNRAQRRAQASRKSPRTLEQTVNLISEHSHGAISVDVFFAWDLPDLVQQAMDGDQYACRCLEVVRQTVAQITAAINHPTKSKQCGACSTVLKDMKFSIGAAQADNAKSIPLMGFAICFECGPDRPRALEASGKALRAIWPDGKIKTITHPEGGHA